MKKIAVALVTALLALGVLAAPAEAKKSDWPCPGCRAIVR